MKANERTLSPSKREALDKINVANDVQQFKKEILAKKVCGRQLRHIRNSSSHTVVHPSPLKNEDKSPVRVTNAALDSITVGKVDYKDFLPNSITRSP